MTFVALSIKDHGIGEHCKMYDVSIGCICKDSNFVLYI